MKKLIVIALMIMFAFNAGAQKKDAKYYYDHAMSQGDLNKVIADFTKAIELRPGFREAYMYRGVAYLNNKALPKAMDDLNKAISMNPNSADAYFYRAQAEEKMNSGTAARKDYDKAIQLSPKFADAYYRRGLLLNASGKSGGCADLKKAKALGYKVTPAELAACGGNTNKK